MDTDFVERLPEGDIQRLAEMKEARDYTRKVYQNLMEVCELLDKRAPLPMTQKQIAEATGMSKATVFDVCWNLTKRGWAEEAGDGSVRLKRGTDDKAAYVGRMMTKIVRDTYGLNIEEVKKDEQQKA